MTREKSDLSRAFAEDGARKTHVGGQALLEGIMMRGKYNWSVAVREPSGAVYTEEHDLASGKEKNGWLYWPLVRGCRALVESLVLGFKALEIATLHAYAEEDEGEEKAEEKPVSGTACEAACEQGPEHEAACEQPTRRLYTMPSYFFLISTYTRSDCSGVPYERTRSFSLYSGFSRLRAIRSRLGVSKYRLVMRVRPYSSAAIRPASASSTQRCCFAFKRYLTSLRSKVSVNEAIVVPSGGRCAQSQGQVRGLILPRCP